MRCREDAEGKLRKESRPRVLTWKLHEGIMVGVQGARELGGVIQSLEYGSWKTGK